MLPLEGDSFNGESYMLSNLQEPYESRGGLPLPPEVNDWVTSCLAPSDELPDNDDDWLALKCALLDTLPSQPVDLFAELGSSSENAFFDESRDEVNCQPSFSSNSLGVLNNQSSNHIDSPFNGDVVDYTIPNSYNVNGFEASTSVWRSTSMDSEEETDEEKEEELLKVSREQGKTRLKFRGKEYIVLNHLEVEDKQFDEEARTLPGEETESFETIFRVWDLETPDEEDELTKQLKKALGKSYTDTLSTTDSPSTAMEDKEVDELVAGIADLSLRSLLSE